MNVVTRTVKPVPSGRFSARREEIRRAWRELRGPHSTPARAAISAALGIFVGCLPIFGCHTPIVVVLCLWFQLDAALAWLMSNVSNPVFAPPLLALEAQTGAWLRTGSPLRLHGDLAGVARSTMVEQFVGYAFLGAPVVGLALAIFGAALTYGVLALSPPPKTRDPYRLPDNAPPWIRAVERVATRFARPDSPMARERTHFQYLRAKLLVDPVARMLAEIAAGTPGGFGTVLDIATGRGQLPLLLLELGLASRVTGIDWDQGKIARANRAAGALVEDAPPLPAQFLQGDMRTTPFVTTDTVLLVDALHYVTLEEQDALLDRAAQAVRPGGRLLLREADAARGWRSLLTLIQERAFTTARFNRGERVRFRLVRDLVSRLEAAGMTCSVRPAWGNTPFSNVLIVAERRADRRPMRVG